MRTHKIHYCEDIWLDSFSRETVRDFLKGEENGELYLQGAPYRSTFFTYNTEVIITNKDEISESEKTGELQVRSTSLRFKEEPKYEHYEEHSYNDEENEDQLPENAENAPDTEKK